MKKGIHPQINKINLILTKKNSLQISSILDVDKLKLDIDIYSHILYNNVLKKNIIKHDGQLNRLRFFKIK